MKKNKSLKVKAVRRYKKPIYPSYLDKNPLEHPDTMPYPFNKKAINALVAAGILVGLPSLTNADIKSSNASTAASVSNDSLVNPFTFDKMGVPYIPASFGTGLPSRLVEKDATEIIEKVFNEEGLVLQKEYLYNKDGVKVMLNGYNTEMQIGYVWVDYHNMGEGMLQRHEQYSRPSFILGKSSLERLKGKDFNEIDIIIQNTLNHISKRDKKEKEKKHLMID